MKSESRTYALLTPNYSSLLTFVDVIYGAVLGYGFVMIARVFEQRLEGNKFDGAAFGLLSFSVFFLVGDYVDARLYTDAFKYRCVNRFFIDLAIAVAFFASFVAASYNSSYYPLIIAAEFILSALWCWALDREIKDVAPLQMPILLTIAHLGSAVLFTYFWGHIACQSLNVSCRVLLSLHGDPGFSLLTLRKLMFTNGVLSAHDVVFFWVCYWAWAVLIFLLFDVFIGIETHEADLYPSFPLGRILRGVPMVARTRGRLLILARGKLLILLEKTVTFLKGIQH